MFVGDARSGFIIGENFFGDLITFVRGQARSERIPVWRCLGFEFFREDNNQIIFLIKT